MKSTELNVSLQKLTKLHRLREDLMKARIQNGNQLKAIERRLKNSGYEDSVEFMLPEIAQAKKDFDAAAKEYEKRMVEVVKTLPVHDWYTQFRGCASSGYAAILAECGDPRNYPNPAKLWKRMGLAVDEEGQAHKNRHKGLESGYSKRRRTIMYRIEEALVKSGDYYRQIYLNRKQKEEERDVEGYNKPRVEANKASMLHFYPGNKKRIQEGRMPQFVLALRAQRVMSKELLKDMWVQWQSVVLEDEHEDKQLEEVV